MMPQAGTIQSTLLRGRPLKHGKKWKLANLLTEFVPKSVEVRTYGKIGTVLCVARDLWIRDVCKKVRVVVVEGVKDPVLFVSTDLSLSAKAIIEIYSSRFSIEIAFRDLKQHFGFGDYQTTSTQGFFRFVHLCCILGKQGKTILTISIKFLRKYSY